MGSKPKRQRLTKTARASLVLLVAFALSLYLAASRFEALLLENHEKELRIQNTIHLIEAGETVEAKVFDHFLLLGRLAAFVEANPSFDQAQYSAFIESLDYGGASIVNYAAAPDLVVRYVYPLEPNRDAIGLDYSASAEQLPEVIAAIENNAATVVGPVDLVQGGRALIIRQPVYTSRNALTAQRELWGIVSIVLDYDNFWASTGMTDLSDEYRLFVTSDLDDDGVERPIFGQPEVRYERPVELTFDFPSGQWKILAVPATGWPTHPPQVARSRLIMGAIALLILAAAATISFLAISHQQARRRLTAAVDAMNDGFAMFDRDGNLVAFNRRYAQIYSAAADEIRQGSSFEDIIRLGAKHGLQMDSVGREEEWVQERVASFRGPDVEFEQELCGGRYYLASDRKLEDGGKVCVRTDVTSLKRAQAKAEAASNAKSRFINALSHELRTPLTVILGTAGLLKHVDRLEPARRLQHEIEQSRIDQEGVIQALADLQEQLAATMERQEKSGRQMLALVEDMLDIAKVESGTYHMSPDTHDTHEILRYVQDQMKQLADEKNLRFVVEAEEGEVFCDRLRTTQILLNLVGNAVKFTPAGDVRIACRHLGSEVAFEVSDTGPGIALDAQARIFDAFEQVDSSDSRTFGGVGLGLAISRGLAVAQGGSIELTSGPGLGSTFTLRLPKHRAGPRRSDTGRDHAAAPTAANGPVVLAS